MKAFILVENIEHQIRTMKNEHSVNFCKHFFIGLSPGFENHILLKLRCLRVPSETSKLCNTQKRLLQLS